MRIFPRSALPSLALALCALHAPGGLGGQVPRVVSLSLDNDGLAVWRPPSRRSDWYYTHGARLEWTTAWTLPGSGLLGLGDLPLCGEDPGHAPCRRSRVALAQRIFTPKSLFSYSPFRLPANSDRPYAGWLSLSVAMERVCPRRSRRYAVQVGMTGDATLARQVHLAIHEWFGKARPVGWRHQIPFEVAGAVSVREEWRVGRTVEGDDLSALLEPSVAVTLGSLRTSGEVGATLHLGWNALPYALWSGDRRVLISLGLGAEAVGRDLFLDGSLWRDSARTERSLFVVTSRLDVLIGDRNVNLRMGATRTSPTFVLQDEAHVFGTIGISLRLH